MNCVFEITLNRPLDVYECVAYSGHWCEFCDEDNGGGKFCYNCGQRESEDYGKDDISVGDDEDLFDALAREQRNEEDETDEDEEDYDWECPCGKRGGYNEDHYEVNDDDNCFTNFYCGEYCYMISK